MIEGTWKLIGGEQAGQEVSANELENSKLEISGDHHTVTLGSELLKGTHTLNEATDPMEIDATDTEGPFAGHTVLGIFKLDGDKLTICFADPGADRPNEFTTQVSKANLLHVWERV